MKLMYKLESAVWDYLAGIDYKSVGQQLLANTVLVGAVGWIAKLWAERSLERLRGEQTKQLEKTRAEIENLSTELKSGIEKRMRVFETHFNLEFSSYQELWKDCDEVLTIASQTLSYIQMTPNSPADWEEEKEEAITRYDRCRELFTDVRRRRPFIAEEIADSSEKLAIGCLKIADKYKNVLLQDKKCTEKSEFFDRKPFINEVNDELGGLEKLYKGTATLISKRIDKLYVADFSLGV